MTDLEDVSALTRILGAIYEQDFVEGSYGFRPGQSCHDALRALSQTVEDEGTNYIAEADIKGFFETSGAVQFLVPLRPTESKIISFVAELGQTRWFKTIDGEIIQAKSCACDYSRPLLRGIDPANSLFARLVARKAKSFAASPNADLPYGRGLKPRFRK